MYEMPNIKVQDARRRATCASTLCGLGTVLTICAISTGIALNASRRPKDAAADARERRAWSIASAAEMWRSSGDGDFRSNAFGATVNISLPNPAGLDCTRAIRMLSTSLTYSGLTSAPDMGHTFSPGAFSHSAEQQSLGTCSDARVTGGLDNTQHSFYTDRSWQAPVRFTVTVPGVPQAWSVDLPPWIYVPVVPGGVCYSRGFLFFGYTQCDCPGWAEPLIQQRISGCVALLKLDSICLVIRNSTGVPRLEGCMRGSMGRRVGTDALSFLDGGGGQPSQVGTVAYKPVSGYDDAARWDSAQLNTGVRYTDSYGWLLSPELVPFRLLDRGITIRSSADPALVWEESMRCAGDAAASNAPACTFAPSPREWPESDLRMLYSTAGCGAIAVACVLSAIALKYVHSRPVRPVSTAIPADRPLSSVAGTNDPCSVRDASVVAQQAYDSEEGDQLKQDSEPRQVKHDYVPNPIRRVDAEDEVSDP